MITINKYEFHLGGGDFYLPDSAEIIKADKQNGLFYLWAIVDTQKAMAARELLVIGTGHKIEANLNNIRFINTIFDGPFVWHVFEVLS